jgi:predicted KAP-like P-loop ATPase
MTRLSRERIAEIRAWAAEWRTKGIGAHEAHALLAHLDAVTRVDDAMVERAARVIYDDASPISKWDDRTFSYRDHYLTLARRALTAALGGAS